MPKKNNSGTGQSDLPGLEKSIPVSAKVAYVKSQSQTRNHECHWTGCTTQVPPALWGCKKHWYRLPMDLRNKIWATYRPGQEKSLDPSSEYLDAADQVQDWIRKFGGSP